MVAARQGDQDAGARATALEAQLPQIQVQQARARAQAFRPRAASGVANGEFGVRALGPLRAPDRKHPENSRQGAVASHGDGAHKGSGTGAAAPKSELET